jgi:hypothetical protein
LAFTEPLRVAVEDVSDVAGVVVTVGALEAPVVLNDSTAPYVVPAAFVATTW